MDAQYYFHREIMRGFRNVRPNVQKMSLIFLLKNIWIITTVLFFFWMVVTQNKIELISPGNE